MRKLALVFGLATATMFGVFQFANWYASNAALPRYCDDPAGTIARVQEIMTSDRPAGDEKRRPYLVAAKLIFLDPQRDGEDQTAYLSRLHQRISTTCQQAY